MVGGKSTIADILRSFARTQPDLVKGRKTLATLNEQKIILLFDGRKASFDGSSWAGIPPPIAVFDQTFVDENVYSGQLISHDHLKKQFGLVIGEEGVNILESIEKTEALEAKRKRIGKNSRFSIIM